jgi:galactokinase
MKNFTIDEAKRLLIESVNEAVAAFAPGRIEFLGNHLDYNGGVVLGTAINAGIYAIAQPTKDSSFHLFSESFQGSQISGSINQLEKQSGKESWGNYCLGVVQVLQDMGLAPTRGFSLILSTDLPMSAGLSSSAAVELATAQCLLQLANKQVTKKELVTIGRRAENEWVGLPCGMLDQGTSAFGELDQLVRIDCSNENFSTLFLPKDTSFWIFDSGIKHDLVDSLYGTRNQECMDALSILQKHDSSLSCLAHCTTTLLEQTEMAENFKKRARHVVAEQERVNQFSQGLQNGSNIDQLGKLLTASHHSSANLFENSLPELDFLVDLLDKEEDIYGARLTGGGFGGAVLAWTTNRFSEKQADSIAEMYEKEWSTRPHFHSFSPSHGASHLDPSDGRFKR